MWFFFSYLNTCDLDITFHFSIHKDRLLNCNLGHSKILFGSIASYSYHFPLSVSNWYGNLHQLIMIPIRHFTYRQNRYICRYRNCIGRTLSRVLSRTILHAQIEQMGYSVIWYVLSFLAMLVFRNITIWFLKKVHLRYLRYTMYSCKL